MSWRTAGRVPQPAAPLRLAARRGGAGALVALLTLALAGFASAADGRYIGFCGEEGVWLQILGAGGSEIDDDRSTASYVVWLDGRARLLVDVGSGTALRFGEAKANFADLDAIVFTKLRASTTADFASLLEGAEVAGRTRLLPVYGPADGAVATTDFVQRLIGEDGLYPYLAAHLGPRPPGGYLLAVRDVPAAGRRRWAGYGTEHIALAAVPVHHGGVAALAWRVRVGGRTLVFAGGFSNRNDVIAEFAQDADALVVDHAVQEDVRGELRERYARPSQIGRIASRAAARMVVLGNRAWRTRGREQASRAALEAHYDGYLIFGTELECWGL